MTKQRLYRCEIFLRWEDYPGLSAWVPTIIATVFIQREANGDLTKKQQRGRDWREVLTAKEYWFPPEARKGKEQVLSESPRRGCGPSDTLTSAQQYWFQTSLLQNYGK